MKYTFEKAEKSTVKMTITLSAEDWADAINTAYEKTKGRYSVPGFRKGKVPKKVIEAAYGTGVFFEDAINFAFPKYYEEVLEKEPSIKDIAQPEVDIKDFSDKGVTFAVTVAVKPEVELGAYKGVEYKKKSYRVTEADIDNEIKRLQERNSRLIDITDRECKNGDTVIIDYSGSVDGVKFDGGTAEKQSLVLGSNSFIPGFEDQVCGMKIGEERDIKVKFPEEYHAENLKGKDSVFHIKLHEIKQKELPEINDEFIKDSVGSESLDAYKKEIKERFKKQNEERALSELKDEIVTKIANESKVEIPEVLIKNQKDRMVQDFEYRLSYQGLKFEDYLKYTGKTKEQFADEYTEQATKLVKEQLVIEQIIENEKIEATEEDVEARFAEMAKNQNKPMPDVKKHIDSRQLDYIKSDIVIKKLFDMLLAENTVK